MSYTNSPLVNYTKLSPNYTPNRTHAIDTITIHCVVGQVTVERLGEIFARKERQASSNYGIGYDGRIGLYVEEKHRSWCSSSNSNDQRAVTIEVASDTYDPYRVTEAAYESLILLVADICKRNGIKKLVWSENKSDRINHRNGANMTLHKDFAAKACPGAYLISKHPEIAQRVNEKLEVLPEGVRWIEVEFNGKKVKLKAALHADENYIRLRDVDDVLGLAKVGYNSSTKTPTLKT